MNIFEINGEIRALLDKMSEEMEVNGCVSDETAAQITALNEQRDAKIEGMALYYKELQAEADAIKEEAKKLADRAKVAQNKADRLKEFIKTLVYVPDAPKQAGFESPRVKIGFRASEKVMIEGDSWVNVPRKYVIVKMEKAVDKTAIKEAIKAGIKVKGAWLETTQNIQIK